MKRVLSLLLVAILMIALVACGSNENSSNNNDTPSTQNSGNNNTSEDTAANNNNNDTFDGAVTEKVLREYKVASESDFTYEDATGGVRITGYTGKDTIVVIPEKIAGKDVVAMSVNSFGTNCAVRGVLIPSNVKELAGVFANNANLEVVIWESAESAGANLFNSCTKLHTVIFGDKLSSIGENAFFYCSSLESLYIPSSVESLDASIAATIFYLCDELTIEGEAGSYIETFCTDQGLTFKAK